MAKQKSALGGTQSLDTTSRQGLQTLNEVLHHMGYTSDRPVVLTQEQVLKIILERIQRRRKRDRFFLMMEDWDWLVVLECMQDHRLFERKPQRMPLTAFVQWIEQNAIPQYGTVCSVYEMSMACRELKGARYPWIDSHWQPHVLERWRYLYQHLDKMLTEMDEYFVSHEKQLV